MQWIKKHKGIFIGGSVVVIILLIAFFLGGPQDSELSDSDNTEIALEDNLEVNVTEKDTLQDITSEEKSETAEPERSEATTEHVSSATTEGTTEAMAIVTTQTTTEGSVDMEATSESGVTTTEATTEVDTEAATFQCTLTISCSDILNHMDSLKPEKAGLVPEGGLILSTTVTVTEGETVYEVLRRTCTNAGIPLDASAGYVKGIQNLYEFDCGSNSGWKYTVNGMFPNYGSNAYVLKEGDSISWNYSCN